MSFSVFNRKQVVSDKPDFILSVGCCNSADVMHSTTLWLKIVPHDDNKVHVKRIKSGMSVFFKIHQWGITIGLMAF